MKRQDVLSWDEYFMGLAHLSAMRSKDPNTQVGAVIVSLNRNPCSSSALLERRFPSKRNASWLQTSPWLIILLLTFTDTLY